MDFETLLQQFMAHLAAAKSGPTYGGRGAGTKSPPMNGAGAPEQFRTVDDFTGAMGAQLDPVLQSPVLDGNPVVQAARMAGRMTGTSPGELVGRGAAYASPYTAVPTIASRLAAAGYDAAKDPSLTNLGGLAVEAGMAPLMMPGPAKAGVRNALSAFTRPTAQRVGMGAAIGGAGTIAASDLAQAEEPPKTRDDFLQLYMPQPFDMAVGPGEGRKAYNRRKATYDAMVKDAQTRADEAYAKYLGDLQGERDRVRAEQNDMSFGERYPGASTGLAVLGNVLAAAAAHRGFSKVNKTGENIVGRADTALQSGQMDAWARAVNEAQLWGRSAPWKKAGTIAAASLIPLEARQIGEYAYSHTLPPDAPARKRYEDQFAPENWGQTGASFGRDLLAGAASAATGTKVIPGGRPNPATQVNALARELRGLSPIFAPMAPAEQGELMAKRLLSARKAGKGLAAPAASAPSAASALGGAPPVPGTGVPGGAPHNALSRARGPQPPAVSGQNRPFYNETSDRFHDPSTGQFVPNPRPRVRK